MKDTIFIRLNLSFFIAKRLMFHRSHRSLSRLIVRLSIGATALSVCIMICASAFVNGFQRAIAQKVFGFWGHVRVLQNYEQDRGLMEEMPVLRSPEVENQIKKNPDIQQVVIYATKSGIIQSSGSLESVLLKGIDGQTPHPTLQHFLQQGTWIQHKDSMYSKDLVISTYSAKQLHVKASDSLLIHFFRSDGTKTARKMRVSGIYKTGIEEYDKNFALCDIRLIQRLNQWESNEIGGYEIVAKDYRKMKGISQQLYEQLPQGWYSKPITEVYPNIFDWLQLQEQIKELLFIIMTVIAILNLITCLIILLLDRTRMTATLLALGAPRSSIQSVFLYNSAFIAAMGIIIGTVFGLIICFIQNKTGLISLNEEAYYVSAATADISWIQIAGIDLATLIICTLCLWLPTWLIKTVNPINIIRQ